MDNNYFDNLYDDLPEEIAELLKSSHPFAENDSVEETLEEKRARRAALRKEAKVTRRAERREEDRARDVATVFGEAKVQEETPEIDIPEAVMNEPEEVKVSEEPVKKPIFDESAVIKKAMEEANIVAPKAEDAAPEAVEEPVEEVFEEEVPVAKAGRKAARYDEEEFDEDDKEAALKRFFDNDDDYYEDEKGGVIGKVIVIVLLILAIAAAVFFGMKYMSAKGEIASFTSQTEEIEKYKAENEELKLQVAKLQDEVKGLEEDLEEAKKAQNAADGEGGLVSTLPSTEGGSGSSTPTTGLTPSGSTTPSASSGSTYTVKDGDSYWGIAVKVYGDGTKYQKILDANGLKESDDLSIGQTLKIPA